jgi:hypothetical protein
MMNLQSAISYLWFPSIKPRNASQRIYYDIIHLKAIKTVFKYAMYGLWSGDVAFIYAGIAKKLFSPGVAVVRRKMKCQCIVIIYKNLNCFSWSSVYAYS